jgi:hypothetical protein
MDHLDIFIISSDYVQGINFENKVKIKVDYLRHSEVITVAVNEGCSVQILAGK